LACKSRLLRKFRPSASMPCRSRTGKRIHTIAKGTAGYLVRSDSGREIFGLFDEKNGLVADSFSKRGQAAVAEFRFCLDVHVDRCHLQFVFFEQGVCCFRIVHFIGIDDLHPSHPFDLAHQLELLLQAERFVVLMEAVFGAGQKTR